VPMLPAAAALAAVPGPELSIPPPQPDIVKTVLESSATATVLGGAFFLNLMADSRARVSCCYSMRCVPRPATRVQRAR